MRFSTHDEIIFYSDSTHLSRSVAPTRSPRSPRPPRPTAPPTTRVLGVARRTLSLWLRTGGSFFVSLIIIMGIVSIMISVIQYSAPDPQVLTLIAGAAFPLLQLTAGFISYLGSKNGAAPMLQFVAPELRVIFFALVSVVLMAATAAELFESHADVVDIVKLGLQMLPILYTLSAALLEGVVSFADALQDMNEVLVAAKVDACRIETNARPSPATGCDESFGGWTAPAPSASMSIGRASPDTYRHAADIEAALSGAGTA